VTLRAHLVRGVVGSLGLTVTSAALTFVNGILLARLLGPAGYGVYASVIAVVLLLSNTMMLGFDRLIVRELAALGGRGEWAMARGLVQRAGQIVLPASIGAAFLVGLLGLLLRDQLHEELLGVLLIGLAIVPLADLTSLRRSITLGLHQIVSAQLPDSIVRPGLFAVLLGATLLTGSSADPQLAIALNLVAVTCAVLVGLGLLVRQVPRALLDTKSSFATRHWILETIPFALLIAVYTFLAQIDVVLVAALAGAEAAGLYSVAVRGASLALFGAAAVAVTLGPTVARLWDERDLPRLQLAVTSGVRGSFVFALAVAVVLIVFGRPFLLLFGPEFTAAEDTLAILAVAQVVEVGLGMGGVILTMTGHQSVALRAGLAAVVVRVGFGVWLIPSLGANGAAIAAILSIVTFNGLMAVAVIRRLKIDPTPIGREFPA
jgi:O-antigen/teichoic acid export membrane protein